MASKKEALTTVSFRVGTSALAEIEKVRKTGILGKTRNDVIVHMMRQYVFDSWLRAGQPEMTKLREAKAAKAPAKKVVAKKAGKSNRHDPSANPKA